jgi:hypothetical protein
MMALMGLRKYGILLVALLLIVAQLPGAALAAGPSSNGETMVVYGRATPASATRTIPYFSDSFDYAGTNYHVLIEQSRVFPTQTLVVPVAQGVVVPTWQSPLPLSSFFYGCSNLLETGDVASDVGFQVNGYQLQDEAFFSWFAKQTPSIGINGQYSFLGSLTQPSPVC